MVITFCGHSNYINNFEDEKLLLKSLEEVANGKQVDFYLGGYGAFDNFALKCAKKYKENHKDTNLIFITPYLGEWLNKRKSFIEKHYDKIFHPEIEHVPQKFAILKRNEWMVKKADYIFGYVQTHYGGAYKMLLYAHNHNKPYINLYKGCYDLY